MQTSRLPQRPLARRGFTLIEVLTVIAILSILMAFLLPAVMRAGSNAKVVQVKTELGNLAAAIATFKQEFGIEPPSRITLQAAGGTWDTESRALISRMWPQFDFNTTSGGATWSSALNLNGAECLVFFLGGVRDSSGQLIGFSRNPAQPFSTSGGNRLNSFYQFDPARLVASDDFLVYRDPLNATNVSPYVYFSSYDGSGYPVDIDSTPPACGYLCNPTGPIIDTSCDTYWFNRDNWSDSANSGLMIRPYYSTVPPISTADTSAALMTAQGAGSRAQLPSSYQIISAGFDGLLGFGGDSSPDRLIRRDLNNDNDVLDLFENRDVERDNITNFSNGQLVP